MNEQKPKYARSCRFQFLPAENHHQKSIKNASREVKMESKLLFASGNTSIFAQSEGVCFSPLWVFAPRKISVCSQGKVFPASLSTCSAEGPKDPRLI
jgi:hypothetical protein